MKESALYEALIEAKVSETTARRAAQEVASTAEVSAKANLVKAALLGTIRENGSELRNSIHKNYMDLWDKISDNRSDLWNKISDNRSDLWKEISDNRSELWKKISDNEWSALNTWGITVLVGWGIACAIFVVLVKIIRTLYG